VAQNRHLVSNVGFTLDKLSNYVILCKGWCKNICGIGGHSVPDWRPSRNKSL